jgi:hypothetical protein
MSGSVEDCDDCEVGFLRVDMSGNFRPLPVGEVGAPYERLFIVCGLLGQAPVRRRGVPFMALWVGDRMTRIMKRVS